MELIIKIDEDIAQGIIDGENDAPINVVRAFRVYIADAIKNGIQLPKEHGKIIDESQITKCYMPINSFDMRGIRTNAPAIIEADKESDIE